MADHVTITGLTKSFGDRRVLSGVDLEVAAGAITAVLGPSGCGKTTLLRVIAGFSSADAGTVSVGGRPVDRIPAHRRRIGLLPQEGALFPYLSVGANVAFGLPRGGRDGLVAHWLDVVGLAGYEDARPHELSGGQQQRVALARALAPNPGVVLLDEPFSALDAGLRVRVREEIADILTGCGTTAILVTHDQSEALSLAGSVAMLMDGVISQHAPPAEVYREPATLAAARFIGATVELSGHREGSSVTCSLGRLAAAGGTAPDGPVTVVLRPEQLMLAGGDAGGVEAEVQTEHYYGTDTALRVTLADGAALNLRVPGAPGPAPGSRVRVAVRGPALTYPVSPP